MTIDFRQIPTTDPRLGRNVKHDSRSLAYPFVAPAGTAIETVQHERKVPIFDQGNLGSCTGNSAVGALGTEPFYGSGTWPPAARPPMLDEDGAVVIYHEATALDDYQGTYPPDDTGSDGLSAAKALKARGCISGYTHVLGGADTLAAALQAVPVPIGINWYESMFNTTEAGEITISTGSKVAGGHEPLVTGYDVARGVFWLDNSWGIGWGLDGRCWLEGEMMERLLGEDGDATVYTPITSPAPTPIESVPLARLLAKEGHWLQRKMPALGAVQAQREVNRYLRDIGAV